jgi:hypothetical protein
VHTQQAVSADPSLPAEHGRMISALANGLLSIADDIGTLLPSRFCCSNMACTSLATVSEGHALVRGRACVCAGCYAVRYVRSLRHLQGRVAMALLSDHFKHRVGICLDLCPELSTVDTASATRPHMVSQQKQQQQQQQQQQGLPRRASGCAVRRSAGLNPKLGPKRPIQKKKSGTVCGKRASGKHVRSSTQSGTKPRTPRTRKVRTKTHIPGVYLLDSGRLNVVLSVGTKKVGGQPGARTLTYRFV